MAPQLHRNCTSERSTCSFPAPLPQTNTYCQLVEGAPPHAAKDCAFLRFTASAFPIYALIKKTTSLRCFHSRNQLSKKAEEDVSPLRAPRLAVGIISLSFRIYCSIGGVQQQATRVSPQTADLYFLLPLHMATLYLSEFLLQAKHRKKAKDFNRQALFSQ